MDNGLNQNPNPNPNPNPMFVKLCNISPIYVYAHICTRNYSNIPMYKLKTLTNIISTELNAHFVSTSILHNKIEYTINTVLVSKITGKRKIKIELEFILEQLLRLEHLHKEINNDCERMHCVLKHIEKQKMLDDCTELDKPMCELNYLYSKNINIIKGLNIKIFVISSQIDLILGGLK